MKCAYCGKPWDSINKYCLCYIKPLYTQINVDTNYDMVSQRTWHEAVCDYDSNFDDVFNNKVGGLNGY